MQNVILHLRGTVTLTERILQPEEFQVNLQFCKQDFQ